MKRIWLAGFGLIAWQLFSMSFGFTEFMYGHPAPVAAVLASLATALAWIVLAFWAGRHHHVGFGIAAAALWAAIVAVLLLTILTKALEGDDGVAPWHEVLLLPLILAGGPLYSLGSLLPIKDSLLGTATVAALILALMATAYLAGRAHPSGGNAATHHAVGTTPEVR